MMLSQAKELVLAERVSTIDRLEETLVSKVRALEPIEAVSVMFK